MKQLTKRKYIAIWYVNVVGVPNYDVPNYIEVFKEGISRGNNRPWYELELLLEAPVLGYFIATKNTETRLEVKEFRIEDYEYEETSKDSDHPL